MEDATTFAVPAPPPAAVEHFGDRMAGLQDYAAALADDGVVRGLIGPREVPRLWDRHILNCALLSDGIPEGARMADVGSGAGLPGLVIALIRPDVEVTLIESLLRRSEFLSEMVTRLGLERVQVQRGRSDEIRELRGRFDVVTARAVAPLIRLVPATVGLLNPRGSLLAMKGESAREEIDSAGAALKKAGLSGVAIRCFDAPYAEHPATVVEMRRRPFVADVSRETKE